MSTLKDSPSEWSVSEMRQHLEKGEDLFVIDVRNREEFEASPLEARGVKEVMNLPYFEILEASDKEEVPEAVKEYAQKELSGKLPRERQIVVVCAKGGTSRQVAEGLRQAGYAALSMQQGMQGWGDYYETRALVESPELGIWQISRPARGCLSYMVASRGEAVTIDALRHIDHYLELAKAKGLTIRYALDTHAHADHISGGPLLAQKLGIPYGLHPYDAIHPIDVLPATIGYTPLENAQELALGSARIKAFHIPGHTLGNLAYLLNGKYLFGGDSIFVESISRPDLGGRADTWSPLHYRSLGRLAKLGDEVVVLPGHFSRPEEARKDGLVYATLGELKSKNEGMRKLAEGEQAFVDYILSSLPVFPPQYVDIKRVNAGLLQADEEKASELELGKNVCALSRHS